MGRARFGHAAAALTEVEEVTEERRDAFVIVAGAVGRGPPAAIRPAAAAPTAGDLDLDANDRRAKRLGDVRERTRQRARFVGRLGLGRHRGVRRRCRRDPDGGTVRRRLEETWEHDAPGQADHEGCNDRTHAGTNHVCSLYRVG